MAQQGLDPVDMGIIYLLQENARSNTTANIGEQVGVSSSTVTNRIKKLEQRGVITGYHPSIDYEKAGLSHHLLVVGTVQFERQQDLVDDIMRVSGVVSVRELLSSRENVTIELVQHTREQLEASLRELSDVGVEIDHLEILKREHQRPYNHFGEQFTNGDETG